MVDDPKMMDAVHRKRLILCIERMLGDRTLKVEDELYVKKSLEFLLTSSCTPNVSFQSPAFQHRIHKCQNKLEELQVERHHSRKTERDGESLHSHLPNIGKITTTIGLPPQQTLPAKEEEEEEEEDTISVEKLQILMQEKKEIHERELQLEQARKKGLLNEIVELTGALKESTLGISRTVKDQTQKLELMKHYAGQNEEELQQQKKMLVERRRAMQYSLWASITMVLWVVALFALTYFVIRLFPKSSGNVCPN